MNKSKLITSLAEYNEFLLKEITKEQMAVLSFAFLYNPVHVDYFIAFKSDQFQTCADYISKNKSLLVLDEVPEEFMTAAKHNLKMYGTLDEAGYAQLMRS